VRKGGKDDHFRRRLRERREEERGRKTCDKETKSTREKFLKGYFGGSKNQKKSVPPGSRQLQKQKYDLGRNAKPCGDMCVRPRQASLIWGEIFSRAQLPNAKGSEKLFLKRATPEVSTDQEERKQRISGTRKLIEFRRGGSSALSQ